MVGAKLANLGEGRPSENSANLQSFAQVSQAAAAELVNVSTRSVASAAKVEAEGVPELVRAVEVGAISVSLAAQVAELPKAEQAPVVALSLQGAWCCWLFNLAHTRIDLAHARWLRRFWWASAAERQGAPRLWEALW